MHNVRDLAHWQSFQLPTDSPEFSIDRYLSTVAEPEDFDLRAKLYQWRDDGIVAFEGAVDHSAIEAFLSDIVFLDKHRQEFDVEVEFRGKRLKLNELDTSALSDTGIKFNCLENVSMAARRLSLNRFVCRFLRHVFQDDVAVLQSLTFWKGSEQSAHLDYPWVCVQTKLPHLAASWIALEDVHSDAGPLAYYPGTHKLGVIAPFNWGNGSIVQDATSNKTPDDFVAYLAEHIARNNFKKKIFLPQRGDVLIWHGHLLHEDTAVKKPDLTRRSYVTHYTSLAAYPEAFKMPAVTAMQLHGGYVFDHPWVANQRLELPSSREARFA